MNTQQKYRPENISQIAWASDELKKEIMRYVEGRNTQPLVLHGSSGTGKSMIANMIPRSIEGDSVQIRYIQPDELNSSNAVKKFFSRDKYFDDCFTYGDQLKSYTIMNEVKIDPKAKHAMRICLDEMEGRDLTIMTTNDLSQLDPAIVSRAKVVFVPPAPPDRFLARAQEILIAENVLLADETVLELLESTYAKYKDNREYYKALDSLLEEVYHPVA